jgi:diaminopropionate ammonia-lyase
MDTKVTFFPTSPGLSAHPPNREVRDFHRALEGYQVTPLHSAPTLAQQWGVREVWVKDETNRLGLPAFKILGASWAIHRALQKKLTFRLSVAKRSRSPLTLVCATEGNHGRAVAWMAKQLGIRAEIFVSRHVSPERVRHLNAEGAIVRPVEGTYDDAVAAAFARAKDPDRLLISDIAHSAEEEVPGWVIEGYDTLFAEANEQRQAAQGQPFDAAFIPAGVGSLAAAGVRALGPRVITVEPTGAACVMRCLEENRIFTLPDTERSVMGGLDCGRPSAVAWPWLRAGVQAGVAITNEDARQAASTLRSLGVNAGCSGAACLGGAERIAQLAQRPSWMGANASVLLVVTEGQTAGGG